MKLDEELRSSLILLLLTLIWGTTFSAIKICLTYFSPVLFVGYRFLIASLVFMPLIGKFKSSLNRNSLLAGFVIGFTNFLAFVLQTIGLKFTSASNAAFITSLNVVFVYLIEHFTLREKPSKRLTLAVLFALTGTALSSLTENLTFGFGDILIFICSIACAFQVVTISFFSKKFEVLPLTFVEILTTSLLSLVTGLLMGEEKGKFMFFPTVLMIYLAVIATSLALSLQILGQRGVSATKAAIIYLLEPIFASFFAIIWLGETYSLRQVTGYFLILTALIITIPKKT